MAWLKLDDAFADHPKVMQAGPLASWLHVCGLLYCSRLLTDGFIPAGQVRKLADVDDANALAEKLVEVGLWERADGGYQIHDYLDFNPTREEALRRREHITEVRREAGRAGGFAKAAKQQTASKPLANDQQHGLQQNASPVPIPYPSHPVEIQSPGGETHVSLARAAPKPKDAVRSNPLWDAVAEICGKPATKNERSDFGETISQLHEAGATPEQVAGFGPWWWKTYPEANLTHRCLRGHWGKYLTAPARPPQVTDLSPAMQAIVQFRRDHEHAELHDLHGKNGHVGSLPERTDGNRPRVVDTVGGVLPGAATSEG